MPGTELGPGNKTGLLNLSTIDIWDWVSFSWGRKRRDGDCSVHCRVFSNISGLCPLNASNTHNHTHTPIETTKLSTEISKCLPSGEYKMVSENY